MKQQRFVRLIASVLYTVTLSSGCHGVRVETAVRLAAERPRCVVARDAEAVKPLPRPLPEDIAHGERRPEGLSERAWQTARRLGIGTIVSEYAKQSEATGDADQEAQRQALLQRIRDMIQLATHDILAVVSEIECEEELATRLAQTLEGHQDRQLRTMTAAAIAIGAAAAIGAGSLALANRPRAGEWVAISGGVAEAGIGAAMLLAGSSTPSVALRHPDNHVREFWDGPEHGRLLPRFSWQWLEVTELGEAQSPRKRWLERMGQHSSEQQNLLLGDGGLYLGDDLRARGALLDMLEDEIELIYRDLHVLLREVLALSAARFASTSHH